MNTRFVSIPLLIWVLMNSSFHVLAYEVETHEKMTESAAIQSSLALYLPEIGFLSLDDPLTTPLASQSILDWIKEGSVKEDDTVSESFFRYVNHFYDPTPGAPNGGGYTGLLIPGLLSGLPSPEWGLESNDIAGQKYSFRDARQYLYDGLTLPSKADRDANLALTFRTLGDVMHLLQDMAQPQHTRNDSHAPGSLFEGYTRDNENKWISFAGGIVPVSFASARDFWTNAQNTGLAQYTNASFVSAGTNFTWQSGAAKHSTNYAYPVPLPVPEDVPVQNLDVSPDILAYCGTSPGCNMSFYSSVNDRGETQPKAATRSIFADDLQTYDLNTGAFFSLNRFNFEAAYPNLVSRAVGYSVGLINYFFRGKIDFRFDPADPTKYLIKNLGAESMNGTFSVYFDAVDGMRYPVKRADGTALEWSTSGSLVPGGALSVPVFGPPRSPAPQTPGTYMLVFKGEMGQETSSNGAIGAVAGKESKCASNTQVSDYPAVSFTGDSSYESMPVTWLSRDADGKLFLDGYIWIKKNPVPPPEYRCFPSPLYGCLWYYYYPPLPYANNYDPTGGRYDPSLQSSDEYVKVWIDLNGDKVFSSDELVLEKRYSPYLVAATWYTNQLISLHEPLTMMPGNACQTGMRTAMRWNKPPTGPNDDFAYGSMTTDQVQLR